MNKCDINIQTLKTDANPCIECIDLYVTELRQESGWTLHTGAGKEGSLLGIRNNY